MSTTPLVAATMTKKLLRNMVQNDAMPKILV
jgi:hypothetical protein